MGKLFINHMMLYGNKHPENYLYLQNETLIINKHINNYHETESH